MTATGEGEFVAHRLRDGDVDAALRLCRIDDIDASVIARELSTSTDYCWMGLYAPDGTLAALHRGMRWYRHLLLKGLFVDRRFQESGVGLRAAFAIRDWARQEGFDGVLAWVEKNKPEAQLAHRLRIRSASRLLHRYLLPLPFLRTDARVEPGEARPTAGILKVPVADGGPPAVRELLGIQQDDPSNMRIGWILDRSRLVLSGNTCRSVTELDVLVHATQSLAPVTGATALEVPFEAADLHAALRLAGMGVRRLSRTPVSLGVASFGEGKSSEIALRPATIPTSKATHR